jgi:antitoxin (DNA-binding transcriptional repressor) of toxin-antitoxin stability system
MQFVRPGATAPPDQPVALLTPIPAGRLDALVAAGRARPAKRRLADLPAPSDREARPAVSQTLAVMRDEEALT